MKITTLLLLLVVVLSSCSGWKKCNRATAKIERAIELCPEIEELSTDTVTVTIPEVRDSLIYEVDSIKIERVVELMAASDTVELVKLVNRPCISDTIKKETDRYRLDIWQVGNEIRSYVQIKEVSKSKTIQTMDIHPKPKQITGWQWFQIWSGRIAWLIVVVIMVLLFLFRNSIW